MLTVGTKGLSSVFAIRQSPIDQSVAESGIGEKKGVRSWDTAAETDMYLIEGALALIQWYPGKALHQGVAVLGQERFSLLFWTTMCYRCDGSSLTSLLRAGNDAWQMARLHFWAGRSPCC
jgi:hypothetical protein